MKLPSALPPSAVALEPLRMISHEFPLFAGAWIGVALAPLALTAVVLGTTVAMVDALSRIAVE